MMKIEFYCPRWGSEDLDWESFCHKVKDEGYHGIEYGISRDTKDNELDKVWNLATGLGLKIIPQHYDTYEADFLLHIDLYCQWLERIKQYPFEKLNSQTGKDFFSFGQNQQLIAQASRTGITVVHETHRNKFAFAAHITKGYLESILDLRLTLDISHWVCVAESYLEDQAEAVDLAIERVDHLHARIGYPEGPQVPDPRTSQWQLSLDKHLSWWDKVAARIKKEERTLTITTEFGPYPYMIHLPGTDLPISNQWEVNVFMLNLLRDRYTKG